MKQRIFLALSLCCFLLSWLCLFSIKRNNEEALAARIAPSVLRFHVIANSDRPDDQQLKMEVKSLVVETINREMENCSSKEEMCQYLTENHHRLVSLADACIKARGFSYSSRLSLSKDYFPEKSYGDITFPCGDYDAARLVIGQGKGHNWWCVLYPSLCFIDPAYASVPPSSKEKLKASLGDPDYHALETEARPAPRIRFKLLELLDSL